MVYETVLYDVADRICTITLNRPEKLNAWTHQMHLDLKAAMQEAGSDPDVRAITRALMDGTIGSSLPARMSVGCFSVQSQGRLVQPVIANT